MIELVKGRPGWKLEPRSTPGASPVWCYVVEERIVLSVRADDGAIQVWVMATDEEVELPDAGALSDWLQTYRADALGERPQRKRGKNRFRELFEWG